MKDREIRQESSKLLERLFPQDVLPTRRFVVELPDYSIITPEPRPIGRGYQAQWYIYPNWVGTTFVATKKVDIEIRAYSAITRFSFKADERKEEWLLDEEGGKGFTLKLFDEGLTTESLVDALAHGAHFFIRVPYRKKKIVDYSWRFSNSMHEFPIVSEIDVDKSGENIENTLVLMRQFKALLLSAESNRLVDPSY